MFSLFLRGTFTPQRIIYHILLDENVQLEQKPDTPSTSLNFFSINISSTKPIID
jgi:hypothetical protein